MDFGPLVNLLIGGSVIGLIGVLLTTRESRHKRYDDRAEKAMERAEARATAAEAARDACKTRIGELEEENDKVRIEAARLRYLLVSRGIDPDAPAMTP